MFEKIKVVAMDLDGTLTQHRTPLNDENRAALEALAKKYKLLMVGAGQVLRIFNQLGGFPVDILGNYGLQYGEYDPKTQTMNVLRNLTLDCDKDTVTAKVVALREKYGFTEYRGDTVEFHPSGCVTFPLLGSKADMADKLVFDPDRKKRRAIYDDVAAVFSEYSVFVGGSSSFDMAPKPHNKFHALDEYCREHGYAHEEVVFIGDDYGRGGNDEAVYTSDFPYLTIDNYLDFPQVIQPLL